MSSDALMDELQSFLDMGASPNPSTGILGPCSSPRASGSVPKQQEGVPSPSSAPLGSYTDVKRKLDASPGHDEIGSYNLNSPAKMPKMEAAVKEEPGLARSGSLSNLRNLSSVGAMSGGTVKTEDDPLAPSAGSNLLKAGMGFKSESGLDEAGEGLVGGEGHQETPVEPDKQKCHATAARIRGALEASGLSGNLTSEDLQTLKRLNEIAKSTGLTQEQKSGEASQLLKNNPNVSRLLLKLRTEKNIQNQNSGMGRGTGPLGRVPEGVGMAGGGRMEPAYPTMQGTRPVNPTGGVYGQAGYGGPGMPGPVYRGQMPPGGQWGHGHPAQQGPQDGFYRSVHGGMGRGNQMGMMEMNPMGQQGMRMHPEMMGPGGSPVGYGGGGYTDPHGMRMMRMPGAHMYSNHMGGAGPMERMSGGRVGGSMDRAPGTVYMNRQTGMTMYQEHPGSMPNMTGMNSRPPPGYNASSVGSPYIPSGNFHPGQMIRGEPGMSPGPRSPYGGMVPGMQRPVSGGYGSPQGAGGQGGQQGAQGGFDTFQGGEIGARGRWEEPGGRENLLTSMPRGSPQPLPPVSESQLRARLSGVTTTSSSNSSSELATRLMAGKNFESSYQGAQGQPRIVGTPNSAPGMHESSPESLFNEINNSQFLQNTATNNYAEKFEEFASEKAVGSWKESQNTNDLRSSWLSRLSKALETSANINSAEAASRMAGDIEEKAFQSADTEAAYANNIAVQLARIFSQQSKGSQQGAEGSSSRPDSTSWKEEPQAAPSSTSPDYGANTHFPTDTTLNFQDKADISESTGAFQTHDTKDFHQASQQHQQQQQQSSSVSPSMKQPGQQQEGGPSTGQHANVIIPRGGRRPSGKQGPHTAQPHSVDSGIESPRSILGTQFSPNPTKSCVTGASPSVTLAENSPEK